MHRAVRLALPIVLAFALPALPGLPAAAAVLTVTKTADTLDGACDPYDCSLREAVTEANRLPDLDVIELPAGVYILTRDHANEDQNVTGDLDVNRPLILVGAGARGTVLDGNGIDRVLDIRAQAEIFGVTLRNGLVDGPGAGAYLRQATPSYDVVVRRSVLTGNHARGSGGDGGGLMSETTGLLTVLESTLSGNRADAKGGGLAAAAGFQLINSTVSGNSAGLDGGALYYPQELSPPIWGSTLTANQAGRAGGGIYAQSPLFPSSVEKHIRGSIVAGNTAPDHRDCVRASSAGYNVFGDGESCSDSSLDRSGTAAAPLDPRLGALADLGGPTPVHILDSGSPAVDLVPAEACTPADQLGRRREASCEAGAVERPLHPPCLPGGPVLCLAGGRFQVTALWYTANTGGPNGQAQSVPLTDDTGDFWFFSPQNLELAVKVIDGCSLNHRWWVFTSGLTDRGVELQVTDLYTGKVWAHHHDPGTAYDPRLDTSALDACEVPGAPSQPGVPGALALAPASAVLIVTKGEDTLDGACDSDCSLREAVDLANRREGLEVILPGSRIVTLSRAGRNENGNATGDLDVTTHLVILGEGADRSVIDGGGIDRVLEANDVNSSLVIHGVTIRNGRAETGDGGGIQSDALTLVGCHLTGNWAAGQGGGFAGNIGSRITVRDSTVSGNEADAGGGIGYAETLRLSNVTVSGNRARSFGGGVYAVAYDQVLSHVTITGNSAPQGGGLFVGQVTCPICPSSFEISNSIVAGNTAPEGPDCFDGGGSGGNVFGIDDGNCGVGPTDRAGTSASPLDPKLTPLGDHGGPTPTHALLADSPAIDLATGPGCPARDQRGQPRPAGPVCDSGAVERHPGCQPDETTLCLGEDDRFRVTARWAARGPSGEQSGEAHTIPMTPDTGSFWFFSPANVELTLKVLDACTVNDRFWVFVSGLTNVSVDIRVEDTLTGRTWTHHNPAGAAFEPRLDTGALDVCPVTQLK